MKISKTDITNIDKMDGHTFERLCALLLEKSGYHNVEVTKGSGDNGADITAYKDGEKYAIQCKRYSQEVGNKAVQEVFFAKAYYKCTKAVVLTNNSFTEQAIEAASKTGVILWDGKVFEKLLKKAFPGTEVCSNPETLKYNGKKSTISAKKQNKNPHTKVSSKPTHKVKQAVTDSNDKEPKKKKPLTIYNTIFK